MTSPSKDTVRVEHTPTPWRVFRSKNNTYVGVGEHNGDRILDAGFGLWRSGPEREANAELIVRAVNAHDELVKALEKAKFWHEAQDKVLSKSGRSDASYHYFRNEHRTEIEEIDATLSRIKTQG